MNALWKTVLMGQAALAAVGCSAPAVDTMDRYAAKRREMVREQIERRGVRDTRVLDAMRAVPRHELVPSDARALAYEDHPLPIGEGQTISQPYIVALMTELAEVGPGSRVLEVGTGSGYQAAVLSELGATVFTIEIVPELGRRAADDLKRLGYDSVQVRIGDGFVGWPEEAPFDAVLVTAAPIQIPQPLLDQLKIGGRLVIPVGAMDQQLKVVTRTEKGFDREDIISVRFVPMTGRARER